MKVNELLERLSLSDPSSTASHRDGTSMKDFSVVCITMNGHGLVADADVERLIVGPGAIAIRAKGIVDEKPEETPKGKKTKTDEKKSSDPESDTSKKKDILDHPSVNQNYCSNE